MARYDYGLRGPRDTPDPRFEERGGAAPGYDLRTYYIPRRTPYGVVRDPNAPPGQPAGERYPYEAVPFTSRRADSGTEDQAYLRPPRGRGGVEMGPSDGSESATEGGSGGVGRTGRQPDEI